MFCSRGAETCKHTDLVINPKNNLVVSIMLILQY